jgi:protein SCO1/2
MKSITFAMAALAALLSLPIASCGNGDNHLSDTPGKNGVAPRRVERSMAGPSLYQLEGEWSNQDNRTISLADLKGKVQVVAMVFTNCRYACPRIITEMKQMESRVPADRRDRVGFVLVSFDVDRDTPARLKEFAQEMNMDERWTLLHGDEQEVRELSVLLGVKYEKQPGGDFAHSSVVTVLDENGSVAARLEGLNKNSDETSQALRSLLE